MNNKPPKNLGAFLLHFVKPYKFALFIFLLFGFIAGFWGPFNSLILKELVNTVSGPKINISYNLSLLSILMVLNFIIFDNITWRTIGYLVYKYLPKIKNDITRGLFTHVLDLDYQFFQDNLSGRVANNITILADNIEKIIYPCIPNLLRGSSIVLVAFISAYFVNPVFFALMMVWLIVFVSVSIYMSTKIITLSDAYAYTESSVSGEIVDSIAGTHNIRIFAKKNYEISRLEVFLKNRFKAFRKEEFWIIIMCIIQGALIAAMLGFALYFLISLYEKSLVSIGDFALILGLAVELGHMIWWTMSSFDDFNKAAGKCRQSLNNLIVDANIKDKENATDLIVENGEIEFKNVTFSYNNSQLLFDGKCIKIRPQEKVGLVGYSGSGKSSFISLILRLFDVDKGTILIDGQDIKDVKIESLREAITFIPQDPILFHRSLMDNIRYGNIEASDKDIIKSAKFAHAHDFISKLPDTYNTLVGERGVKLSGGQRQRVAIARGFIKNSSILILDEATSQLDSVTEGYIQESLSKLMKNKTTIVVAHRLSTLLKMDRILVFAKGKIVEDGTHKELLLKNGLYKKLWDAQVGGFLGDQPKEPDSSG